MNFRVRFQPLAEADLFALYDYIAHDSGPEAAERYIDRIEAACLALERFPRRGTQRNDIRPGLRTMGFERRATIVFQIRARDVLIVRVLYGGRDIESGWEASEEL